MPDEKPKLSPQQQAAYDAILGTVQRVAMKIAELPPERRDGAYDIARRHFEDMLREFGFDPEQPDKKELIDLNIQGIRALVTEMGNKAGNA